MRNRLHVGVRAKNASVSGFACRPFSGKGIPDKAFKGNLREIKAMLRKLKVNCREQKGSGAFDHLLGALACWGVWGVGPSQNLRVGARIRIWQLFHREVGSFKEA